MLLKSCYTTDEKQWKDIINNISLEGGKNSILWKPELLDNLVDVDAATRMLGVMEEGHI